MASLSGYLGKGRNVARFENNFQTNQAVCTTRLVLVLILITGTCQRLTLTQQLLTHGLLTSQ